MSEAGRREEAMRSAMQRLPVAVVVVDGQQRLQAFNQKAADLFANEGLTGDLLQTRPTHPLARLIAEIQATKGQPGECVQRFPSGRRFRIEPSRRSEKGMDRWLMLLVSPAAESVGEEFAFTPREQEIADLLAAGSSTEEICAALSISRETLKSHIRGLFEKSGTSSRAGLVAKLLRR